MKKVTHNFKIFEKALKRFKNLTQKLKELRKYKK